MRPEIELPEYRNRRLEPTGLATPGKTRGLTGTGPGLARQDAGGRVFGQVWNRSKPFYRSEPGPLAGYPDPLLILASTEHQQSVNRASTEHPQHIDRALPERQQNVNNLRCGIYFKTRVMLRHVAIIISLKYFRPSRIVLSLWTCCVRTVRDTPVAEYSAPGFNTTRRVAYHPLIAVSQFLYALSFTHLNRTLWR